MSGFSGGGFATERGSKSGAAAALLLPAAQSLLLHTNNRYTQTEDDFTSPEEYDNYLETVEDISECIQRAGQRVAAASLQDQDL